MNSSIITDRTDSISTVFADLVRDGRGWILLTVSFGWFLGLGIRLAAPVLVPHIRADFDIGLSTAGLLLSTLWVTYATTQFPGGVLGDRIGERNVLVIGSILAAIATAAAALVWSVYALLGAFVLLGTATGVYATTRFTSLIDVYPNHAATVTGLCSAAGNVGSVLLPAGTGILAVAFGWRFGFVSMVPLFVLAGIGLWFTVPSYTSEQESEVDDISVETIRRLASGISGRRTVILTLSMFLMSFVYQGFTSFYPSFLISVKGFSESSAAIIYSFFFAAGIFIQPLAGGVADAVGDRQTMIAFAGVSTFAFVLLILTPGFWPLVGVSVLLGAQLGYWPIAQAAVVDTLPTEMQGTGFGLLRTVYLLLAASAPASIGLLADRGFFAESFLLLAGCAAITAILGLGVARRSNTDNAASN